MSIDIITLKDYANMNEQAKSFIDNYPVVLKIRYADKDFPTLNMTEKGDWIDIKATKDYDLKAGESEFIDLGVAMNLPSNYEAWLVPRSGTFKKYGLIQTNGTGIIDNSYSGNNDIWMMPVYATRDTHVAKGERLCQFRLVERMSVNFSPFRISQSHCDLYIVETDQLDDIDRGGFGSSGR